MRGCHGIYSDSLMIYPLDHLPLPPQVEDLRKAGLEPYAYRFDRSHYTSELQV